VRQHERGHGWETDSRRFLGESGEPGTADRRPGLSLPFNIYVPYPHTLGILLPPIVTSVRTALQGMCFVARVVIRAGTADKIWCVDGRKIHLVKAWEHSEAPRVSAFGRCAGLRPDVRESRPTPPLLSSFHPPRTSATREPPQRRLMEDIELRGGVGRPSLDLTSGHSLPVTAPWTENSRCVSVKTANATPLSRPISHGRQCYPIFDSLSLQCCFLSVEWDGRSQNAMHGTRPAFLQEQRTTDN